MKKVKKLTALVMAVMMCFGLSACGGSSSETTTGSDTAATPAAGSSDGLNIHIETEVQSLDPQIATDGTSFEVIADFTDGLYQVDADGNPIPALAQSEEVSKDGLTYTFKIRDDANWSNGDPVTANDFVFAWQRAVDPEVASEYSFIVADVALVKNGSAIVAGEKDKSELGVTAKDDKTLVVELESPVSYFNSLMYFPTFYPVNQKFFESCGDTYATSADTLLACGAFKITQYEPAATSFALTKNDSYYAASDIALSGLNYQVIKDNQQALLSYQSGDLDVITVSGEQVEQVSSDPEFSTVNAGYLWYVSPNMASVKELNNLNMRMAINCAFDRDAVANNVVKDGSLAATFAVPDGLATGPDGKDFRETAKSFQGTDKDLAKEYFDKACKELGQDTFEFEMVVDDDESAQNVAAFIQEEIQSTLPNIKITLKVEPKKQRVEDLQNGNFELGLTRWGPDYADPMTYLGMWYTNNPNNYGLWSNKEYDKLLDKCTTGDLAMDVEGRWSALHQAEELVMNDAVILPVYEKKNAVMTKSGVSGIEFHPIALNRVFKNATK